MADPTIEKEEIPVIMLNQDSEQKRQLKALEEAHKNCSFVAKTEKEGDGKKKKSNTSCDSRSVYQAGMTVRRLIELDISRFEHYRNS